MARIHGKRGQVLMDPTGGVTTVAVTDMNEWTLDLKKDRVDVTSFGDLNKVSVLGLPSYEGTIGGFWNSTAPAFMDAVMGDIAVTLKLLPSSTEATFFWSGLAYLDGNIKVSATGAVTMTGSFAAAGSWTMAP